MNEVFNCVEDLFSKELLYSDFLSLIAFRTDPLKDVVAIVVVAVVVVVVGVGVVVAAVT